MPLTSAGKEVMANMAKEYGAKKGKQVFYATANKMGGNKWHHSPDMNPTGSAQPGSNDPSFPESAKSKKIKKWGPTHVTQSK